MPLEKAIVVMLDALVWKNSPQGFLEALVHQNLEPREKEVPREAAPHQPLGRRVVRNFS
ncbi:hypothetical protein M406DRAFT_321219 [Cryphonectria parasitica EP155]|uniref:Uncharacterized protein n=1 Tax=Cryphonectria parasitica (strain ATCC 38755 / EP155) TaxID=660469 RepID=A0A9P5CSE5_CRYP1|nr:uncharacterized protein M406DRAFT_321219 [Cryphonectria parasitica EP155]KAF3769233.1 hypothetical protein M406DRAFT_321219 [Cryphonectria parasitica EP155]